MGVVASAAVGCEEAGRFLTKRDRNFFLCMLAAGERRFLRRANSREIVGPARPESPTSRVACVFGPRRGLARERVCGG